MVNKISVQRDRSWFFNYPVYTLYEPGPGLLPSLMKRFSLSRPILKVMSYFRLTDRPFLVRKRHGVNERIVEVPFVIRNIGEDDRRILDIGCCESVLPLELAHLGFGVWGLDQRRYPLSHPNLKFVQGDICSLCFPADFFDTAICLSTLEHIGIGYYGDTLHERGDATAIKELWRVLKPGGKLILTAPFGEASENWQRIYDSAGMSRLLSGFRIEKARYYKKDGEVWLEAKEDEVRTVRSETETRGAILLVARKP